MAVLEQDNRQSEEVGAEQTKSAAEAPAPSVTPRTDQSETPPAASVPEECHLLRVEAQQQQHGQQQENHTEPTEETPVAEVEPAPANDNPSTEIAETERVEGCKPGFFEGLSRSCMGVMKTVRDAAGAVVEVVQSPGSSEGGDSGGLWAAVTRSATAAVKAISSIPSTLGSWAKSAWSTAQTVFGTIYDATSRVVARFFSGGKSAEDGKAADMAASGQRQEEGYHSASVTARNNEQREAQVKAGAHAQILSRERQQQQAKGGWIESMLEALHDYAEGVRAEVESKKLAEIERQEELKEQNIREVQQVRLNKPELAQSRILEAHENKPATEVNQAYEPTVGDLTEAARRELNYT